MDARQKYLLLEFEREIYKPDTLHKPLSEKEVDELKWLLFNIHSYFPQELLKEAIEDNPLKLTGCCNHTIYSNVAPFLFRCGICTEIGMEIQWYQIILDTIGGSPFLHQKTNKHNFWSGYTGFNLSKIVEKDTTDYQASGANFMKDFGYICDHCRDSCFDEKGQPLK